MVHDAMPTVLRVDGLRVVIYPNDHRRAHVHVIGAGCEAVFILNCPDGPPVLRESFGFGYQDANRIGAMPSGNLAGLCKEWRILHGHD